MSTNPLISRVTKQPIMVILLIVTALGVCGWSAVQYIRSAPIQEHVDRGIQFQNQGQPQDAEREWREAATLDNDNAQVWELLGDLYLKERNFEKAKGAFDNLFRLAPGIPDLKTRMAIVAYQLKDNGKARELVQAELKENRDNIAALRILAHVEKDVHPDVMLDALQRLVKLQPQSVEALTDLVQELQTRDAYEQILPLADRMIKLAPDSSDSYLMRGLALYMANPTPDSLERAHRDLTKALQLDSDSVEAHRYLGRLYLRQNKPQLAITQFEAVGKGRPYASAHLLELSQAYRRVGNIKKADELRTRFTSLRELNTSWNSLTDKIQRDPRNADYYVQLTSLLLNRSLGSNSSAYYLYSFQLGRGKLVTIQQYLDEAARLNPKHPALPALKRQVEATYNRCIHTAEQALRAQDYGRANEYVGRALLVRPSTPQVLQLAQQVQSVGYNPFPVIDPKAAPDPHKR